MSHRLSSAAALLLATLGLSQPARADDVSLSLDSAVLVGQGQPRVWVTAGALLRNVRLELQRSDGRRVNLSAPQIKAGARQSFELGRDAGAFHFEGKLTATTPNGPLEVPLQFDTALLPPPALEVKESDVELPQRRVTFRSDRPLKGVQFTVRADDGRLLAEQRKDLSAVDPAAAQTLTWSQPDSAVVMQLHIRAEDKHGFFQELDLFPWQIDIPHEDVLFDSGRSSIPEAEQPKLNKALEELNNALQRFGKYATVELFVGGHTDRVGDAAANQKLSEARAMAIAKWFRQRGARIGISYAGLGESMPLVSTADEVAEPRNRRAQYTVSVTPPRGARWTKLP